MLNNLKKSLLNSYLAKSFLNILPYIKPFWFRSIIAILITIPVGMMDAIIAFSLKPYMDVVMIEKNLSSSLCIPVLIIGFSLIQSILTYASTYLNAWVGAKISCSLKSELFNKLMHYKASFFDKNTSGTIQYRFNNDVDSACNGLLNHAKMFTTRIFSSISLTCVLLINSWKLAIVAISVLVIALFPLKKIRKRIKGIMKKTVFSGSEIMTHFSEAFSGNRIISSYGLYDYQNKKFASSLNNVFAYGMKMVQRTGILSPILHFLVAIGIAAIIWLGSYFIVSGQLTPGGFVSFITALLLLYQPVKSMGNDFNALQISLMALERVFELINSSVDIEDNSLERKELKHIKDGIKFNNINFSYVNSKPVLENINFEVKKGKMVAFVGNSGGGKTTLVNLLPRFYDPSSGEILIDDINIKSLNLRSLREKISIVFQDNFLFSGTIRDNIVLGNENISNEDLGIAIKSACLDEFVKKLDFGLDTLVGERGVLLSGGQKQRIAIARAFLKNSPIVILDEATSALDNKSEAVVQKAINNLMKDRTVFVIAHRLSTIRNADKIFVVNNGKIIESGTHKFLMNKGGAYYALYNEITKNSEKN